MCDSFSRKHKSCEPCGLNPFAWKSDFPLDRSLNSAPAMRSPHCPAQQDTAGSSRHLQEKTLQGTSSPKVSVILKRLPTSIAQEEPHLCERQEADVSATFDKPSTSGAGTSEPEEDRSVVASTEDAARHSARNPSASWCNKKGCPLEGSKAKTCVLRA